MDINADRMLGLIEQINQTMPRPAYTQAETRVMDLLARLVDDAAGCAYYDLFGNLILTLRPGMNREPAVTLGSHVDTVPTAGRFDGVLGTAAAVEILLRIKEECLQLARPVQVVIHRAEESARFGVGCLGSKLALGLIDPETAFALKDDKGNELRHMPDIEFAHTVDLRQPLENYARASHSYLELHIEQGPVLEKQGKQIGVVTGIAAPTRVEYVFTGRPDHSGTTPMHMRRDALVAAATFVSHLATIARGADSDSFRYTVGRFNVEPNAVNTVPSRVSLTIDVREMNLEVRDRFLQQASHLARALNRQCGLYYPHTDPESCQVQETVLQEDQPQRLDACIQGLIWRQAELRGYPCNYLVSGASHDAASYAAAGIPTGMIFVPSKGGRSHCPEEDTDEADLVAGAQVLCDTVLALAQE